MRTPRPFRTDASHAHPLVREFYRLLADQQTTALDVAERAGLSTGTISDWRTTYAPRVGNLDAALRVLGYRLAIVPVRERNVTAVPVAHAVGERRPNDRSGMRAT